MDYLRWEVDSKNRIKIMPCILDNLALITYRGLSTEQKNNYCSIMAVLKKAFGIESKNAVHVYSQLERKQGKTETIESYAKEILQRLQNMNITDERYMLATYLKGLRSEILSKVLLMSPAKITDAVDCSLIVQQSLLLNDTEGQVRDTVKALTRQVAEISENRDTRKVSFEERNRNNSRERNSQPNYNRGDMNNNRRRDNDQRYRRSITPDRNRYQSPGRYSSYGNRETYNLGVQ